MVGGAIKESEEMSDEVKVEVRKRGVVIETAGCRRCALAKTWKVKHREGATLGCGEALLRWTVARSE